MEGPGKKTGTEHLRAPCHLRRPLGAGTLLVAWRGYGGRSGVRAAVLALTPPRPPTPPNPSADSFGIRLVPQASEDKFDCYKCHWRQGSMCGYGICE